MDFLNRALAYMIKSCKHIIKTCLFSCSISDEILNNIICLDSDESFKKYNLLSYNRCKEGFISNSTLQETTRKHATGSCIHASASWCSHVFSRSCNIAHSTTQNLYSNIRDSRGTKYCFVLNSCISFIGITVLLAIYQLISINLIDDNV